MNETGAVRCAVYTRKSTTEGLEQEFNSLDAQRESAQAYIASQRHEGWVCLPSGYDDGGCSGGSIQRPALQQLLADIEAGTVDCVVVYKVDRLSRSLLDFARIIERFQRHGVSLVSVTQQFNTTSSMGRLTLNVLLSFAQFEREIISERTRDKMAAARRKGRRLGGVPVLGYDVQPTDKQLVVNTEEAEQVRAMYELYLQHRGLVPVLRQIQRRGWRTKRWVTNKGIELGGSPFTKSGLHRLLRNVTYTGKVSYKGALYEGQHDAVVGAQLWQRVQEVLRDNYRAGAREGRNRYGALLQGLLRCTPCGTGMGHTCTQKKDGKRYRYYVCRNAQQRGWASCPHPSLNAHEIEAAVVQHIRAQANNEGDDRARALEVLDAWESLAPLQQARTLRSLIERVGHDARDGTVTVAFRSRGDGGTSPLEVSFAFQPRNGRRNGHRTDPDPDTEPGRVPRIARLMALAIRFEGLIRSGQVRDYAHLARLGYVTRARITQIMNLLYLAPDIQEALLFWPPTTRGRDPICEQDLRPIAAITQWSRQRALWAALLKQRPSVRP